MVLRTVQGLRTQENCDFLIFFKQVQSEARKMGKVFFLDCEEGCDGNVDGIETCNLSGWLIPIALSKDFEAVWTKNREDDEWADYFCFVRWKNEKGLKIEFD